MIKALADTPHFLRFGGWVFICLPKRSLDDELRARIRPLVLGGLACWFDRAAYARD